MPPVFASSATILDCSGSILAAAQLVARGREWKIAAVTRGGEIADTTVAGVAAVAAAARVLLGQRGRGEAVWVVVPDTWVASRNLRLPAALDRAQRQRVLAFEAKQGTAADAVGAVHLAPADVDARPVAWIAHADRATVEMLCAAIEAAGASIGGVIPAAFARWVALRHQVPDKITAVWVDLRGPGLLQHLSATSFALRHPIAGDSGDQPVDLERVAERANELLRLLLHYERELGFASPARIVVPDAAAAIDPVVRRLAERLGADVVPWAVDPCMGCAKTTEADGISTACVGAAILAAADVPPGMDLTPEAVHVRARARRRRPWLFATAALLVVASLPWVVGEWRSVRRARQQQAAYDIEIRNLQQLDARLRGVQGRLAPAQRTVAVLTRADAARHFWLAWLGELQVLVDRVGDIWLEQLDTLAPDADHPLRVVVNGCVVDRVSGEKAVSLEKARQFLDALTASPFVQSVRELQFDDQRRGTTGFGCVVDLRAPGEVMP